MWLLELGALHGYHGHLVNQFEFNGDCCKVLFMYATALLSRDLDSLGRYEHGARPKANQFAEEA